MLAVQADGHNVETVEGMATASELDPIQEGFKEKHGLQCGFCTPGLVMAAHDLLERVNEPSESQVREELSGNICRCTGYGRLVQAVQDVAAHRAGRGGPRG